MARGGDSNVPANGMPRSIIGEEGRIRGGFEGDRASDTEGIRKTP